MNLLLDAGAYFAQPVRFEVLRSALLELACLKEDQFAT